MDDKNFDSSDHHQNNDTSKNSKKTNRLGNWFHSLTRNKNKSGKKQQISTQIVDCNLTNRSESDSDLKKHCEPNCSTKKDDNINVFHKLKMDFKFTLKTSSSNKITKNQQITINSEPNTSEQQLSYVNKNLSPTIDDLNSDLDSEKPFTYYYRRHIKNKWLEQNSGPNLMMYKACSEMIDHVWYWGETKKQDAQKQLTGKPNGSFLVRDSESEGSQFTLSFRICNCTLHYRLQYRDNYWYFEEFLKFQSIVEMIENIMNRSTDEHFVCYVRAHNIMQPPIPVYLRNPISRYVNIPTLQDLCRRSIQRIGINSDQLQNLPIPIKLQQYLTEKNSLIF